AKTVWVALFARKWFRPIQLPLLVRRDSSRANRCTLPFASRLTAIGYFIIGDGGTTGSLPDPGLEDLTPRPQWKSFVARKKSSERLFELPPRDFDSLLQSHSTNLRAVSIRMTASGNGCIRVGPGCRAAAARSPELSISAGRSRFIAILVAGAR